MSSPITEKVDENWGEVVSRILLKPEYAGALLGLKDFSHAIIVTYLHEAHYEKEKHLQRRPRGLAGGYRKPSEAQRDASRISKNDFDRWFQQIWNIPGASTKQHPAPFPLELATRLVRMFSFVGDNVLDPFSGSGTTMIAAFRTGRNSIGVEIDPDYYRMAARYLKAETSDLFSSAQLIFEKISMEQASMVKEDQALFKVRSARRKIK